MTRADREITLNSRPVLFDSVGREIVPQASSATGTVVTRSNSGYLLGGTGYAQHGASSRKRALAGWQPWSGSPDSDIVQPQRVLRARSRDLYMSFPVGRAAIETKVNNVIGTGIRPIPLPDAEVLGITPESAVELGRLILQEWRLIEDSCDWDRQNNLYGKQAEIYRTKEIAGDAPAFFCYRQDGNQPYSLKLKTIDPDRISNPYDVPTPTDAQNIWGGVELDGYAGPLLAYWVSQFHPGDLHLAPNGGSYQFQRVPVFTDEYLTRNASLHFAVERPGQRRGVPPLAVCFELAKGMQRFLNAKIAKEVIANFFSVFVKSPMPTDDVFRNMEEEEVRNFFRVFPYDVTLGEGGVTFMKPGDTVEFAHPNLDGTDYKVFEEANHTIICSAVQVPYEIVMMKFGASYSASRAAFEEFSKTIRVDRQLHVDQIDQPFYESFIGEMVINGKLRFKKYFKDYRIRKALARVLWTGMSQGTIDPLKDIQAAMLRVQLGVSTVQREHVVANGGDWEETVKQLAQEKQTFEGLGLQYLAFPGMPNLGKEKIGEPGPATGSNEGAEEEPVAAPAASASPSARKKAASAGTAPKNA